MKEKIPFKKEKLQERILSTVNCILRFKIADSVLQFVTMTKVSLNDDLSVANIYWDSFDLERKEEFAERLSEVRSKIRSMLASKLQVRHVPDIFFHYDGQYEAEKNIENILKQESSQGKF